MGAVESPAETEGVVDFFNYARERYSILLKRRADEKTLTHDPILRKYRFCNIFREDDRTTQWFREHIRGPMRHDPTVAFATICFRWFNRIETGKVLVRHNLHFDWEPLLAAKVLRDLKPLVTGAYMIKTPPKMDKLTGLIWCLQNVWNNFELMNETLMNAKRLQDAHTFLRTFPYLGNFMAYEVVTDLRHTFLLEKATDINRWACAGPGAARGLGRVFHGDVDTYSYGATEDQILMQEEMRTLLELSQKARFWQGPKWEMREVEHTLCEFDKYERARKGEGRPKEIYRGSH